MREVEEAVVDGGGVGGEGGDAEGRVRGVGFAACYMKVVVFFTVVGPAAAARRRRRRRRKARIEMVIFLGRF